MRTEKVLFLPSHLNLSVTEAERRVPDLGGKSFQSFTIEYDVSCGFFNLYQLE